MGWITKFHDKPAYIDNETQMPVYLIVAWVIDVGFDAKKWRQLDPEPTLPFDWSEIADAMAYFQSNPDEITQDIINGLTPLLTSKAIAEEFAYG